MTTRPSRRLATAVAAAAVALTAFMPAQAMAAPQKLPAVKDLALTVTKPSAQYRVVAKWSALAGATKYAVAMIDPAGTKIGSATVTDPTWTRPTSLGVGSKVTVQVTAYAGHRRGRTATVSTLLPDVTAPTAAYSVLRNPANETDGQVSLRRDSVTDDLSAASAIEQVVDWGDGSAPQPWSVSAETLAHTYPAPKAVYYPTVTATDEAGNAATTHLTVVVNDTTAPSGAYAPSAGTNFARWTKVGLNQLALSDDLSANDKIERIIDWGDGTPAQRVLASRSVTHVYATGGTFQPTVVLVDEAGNQSAPVAVPAVDVVVDRAAPVAKLVLPKTKKSSVRSWTTLRGTAKDAGVGTKVVNVRVVEKRGAAWYAYNPTTRTWAKAGATKAAAMKKARVAAVRTSSSHAWSLQVRRLTKGTLVYKTVAVDNVGNASAAKVQRQVLTKR